MSYSGFRSKFKSETGLSPRQFQLQIRINRAKDMLKQTNLSISEISDILAFCSLFYFSRIFRDKTGFPPNEYRKS